MKSAPIFNERDNNSMELYLCKWDWSSINSQRTNGIFVSFINVPWNEFKAKFFDIFKTCSILWDLLGFENFLSKLFVDLEM